MKNLFYIFLIISCFFILTGCNEVIDVLDDYVDISQVYIDMVKDVRPFNGGRSYGEAFDENFDSNQWTYFESNGRKIVQVVSSYNDIDQNMILQFLIEPTGDFDEYSYRPYAMQVGDQQLDSLAMAAVIAQIFEAESSQTFADAFMKGLLYGF